MDLSWAMNQDAVYRKLIGQDGWGRAIYMPDTELKVRWQFKQKLVRAANGQEVMSEAEAWVPLTISPKADDVFVYSGQTYKVINIGTPVSIYGETGHHKVFCVSIPAEQGGGRRA